MANERIVCSALCVVRKERKENADHHVSCWRAFRNGTKENSSSLILSFLFLLPVSILFFFLTVHSFSSASTSHFCRYANHSQILSSFVAVFSHSVVHSSMQILVRSLTSVAFCWRVLLFWHFDQICVFFFSL